MQRYHHPGYLFFVFKSTHVCRNHRRGLLKFLKKFELLLLRRLLRVRLRRRLDRVKELPTTVVVRFPKARALRVLPIAG